MAASFLSTGFALLCALGAFSAVYLCWRAVVECKEVEDLLRRSTSRITSNEHELAALSSQVHKLRQKFYYEDRKKDETEIARPFFSGVVCENYQTQRPTKQKPKQPHELTGKAKIWAQYDYDLPPTVTPYVTFEMNEKKWQNWLESKRGQNYLLLYGQHSVDKAHDKYVFRSKEWHDDPEGCTKVINDFQKQMFFKTINQTAETSEGNTYTHQQCVMQL